MHYIKDIFENKKTKQSHSKFIRYSKGNFVGPLMKIKFQKANIKIGASFHFVDELLDMAAEIIGNDIVHIKGILVWNSDLSEDLGSLGLKHLKVTKSRGIFKYFLDNDVKLKEFVDMFNKYHLLITVKSENMSIVTKSAFPKPNKPFGPDFCKVLFPVELKDKIMSEFAFDVTQSDFKSIKDIIISHEIDINEIILPKDVGFEEARVLALRKGELRRNITVNGSEEPSTSKITLEI